MNKLSLMPKLALIGICVAEITQASNHALVYSSLNNWQGFYAGVNAGFGVNKVALKSQHVGFANTTASYNTSSHFLTFVPGINFGYMYQYPTYLVTGVEANITFNTNQEHILNCVSPFNPNVFDRFAFRNQMQSSIKARLGRIVDWNKNIFLPYLAAGGSMAKFGLAYNNEATDYYSKSTIETGWLLGAGIEWFFRQNASLRAEYTYLDYGNNIRLDIPRVYGLLDPSGYARVNVNSHHLTATINYWF